jgi:hypothetical protein
MRLQALFRIAALLGACASAAAAGVPEIDGIRLQAQARRAGDAYSVLRPSSLADCIARCARAERCVTLDYSASERACRLMDRFTPLLSAPGTTSGAKRLWPGYRPNTREIDGMLMEYDRRRSGGDYYTARTASAEDCVRLCAYRRRCQAVSYDLGTRACRLKNRVPSAHTTTGSVSAMKYGAEVGQRRRRR